LIRPYVELDIYGSDGSLTFLGEAKTRLAVRHVKRLEKKIETVTMRKPELLRGRVVMTIYAMWVHPEAFEECRARNIWLNMPDRELTELEQIVSQASSYRYSDCWILEIVYIGCCLFAGLTWLM
jgi:hypothetical protein